MALLATPPPLEPASLLARAFLDRVTGALHFTRAGVERTAYLHSGRPVFVTSNVADERLGAILLRKEKITESELKEAVNFGLKKRIRLLEVFVQMGVLSEQERTWEVTEHYAERLLALFAWNSGVVQFRESPVPAEETPIVLPPERLLLEGLRRHYDLPRLQGLLDAGRVLRSRPASMETLEAFAATPTEEAVLRYVDGTRSIAEVLAAAEESADAPTITGRLRMIYACLCLEVVS